MFGLSPSDAMLLFISSKFMLLPSNLTALDEHVIVIVCDSRELKRFEARKAGTDVKVSEFASSRLECLGTCWYRYSLVLSRVFVSLPLHSHTRLRIAACKKLATVRAF